VPRPPGIEDVLNHPADNRTTREPDKTYDGKTFAQRLLSKKPPGDSDNPRASGNWRPAA
jgi:hypothetical protein